MSVDVKDEVFGAFDFSLDDAAEARAQDLHSESIIVDMLFNGPAGHRAFTEEGSQHLRHTYDALGGGVRGLYSILRDARRRALRGEFPEYEAIWRATTVNAVCIEVELHDLQSVLQSFGHAQAMFDRFEWLRKATTAQEIRDAVADGKIAGWMSSQHVSGPMPSLDLLEHFHELGLRILQLSYNSMTPYASGCTERTDAGVSNLGAKLIRRMNELGIIVDTAHCGRQTTLDACELSASPVIATHTCADAINPHARAKSDEELTAIAATGGVIGVVTVPFFVTQPGMDNATIEATLDHIDHIVGVVGADHVALGTDWPYEVPKWVMRELMPPALNEIGFRPEDLGDLGSTLEGFDDYRDLPNITRGLVARGYSDTDIRGILGETFLRVFQHVCG